MVETLKNSIRYVYFFLCECGLASPEVECITGTLKHKWLVWLYGQENAGKRTHTPCSTRNCQTSKMAKWLILLLLPMLGCLHRQQRIEREWRQIHEVWQIERADDCDYVDVFKKNDCLKRHSRSL